MVRPVRHATSTGADNSVHVLGALVAVSRLLVTATPTIYHQQPKWLINYSVGPIKDEDCYGVLKCKRMRSDESTKMILGELRGKHGFVEQVIDTDRIDRGYRASQNVAELVALTRDEILTRDEGEKMLKELMARFHNHRADQEFIVYFVGRMTMPSDKPTEPFPLNEAEREELFTLYMKWARRFYEESYIHWQKNLQMVFYQIWEFSNETLDSTSVASNNIPVRESLRCLLNKLRRWTEPHEAHKGIASTRDPFQTEHSMAVIDSHVAPMYSPVSSPDAESSSGYQIDQCTNEPMDTTDAPIDLSSHRTDTESRSAFLPVQEWPLDLSVRRSGN